MNVIHTVLIGLTKDAKYLQDYLDEFTFRYSHRHERAELLDLVLASCGS